MFLMSFCCANSRDNEAADDNTKIQYAIDPNRTINIDMRLRAAKNVLVEFM